MVVVLNVELQLKSLVNFRDFLRKPTKVRDTLACGTLGDGVGIGVMLGAATHLALIPSLELILEARKLVKVFFFLQPCLSGTKPGHL